MKQNLKSVLALLLAFSVVSTIVFCLSVTSGSDTETKTYPCMDTLPQHIPGEPAAQVTLHINIADDISTATEALIAVELYDTEWVDEGDLYVNGFGPIDLPMTGNNMAETFEINIPVGYLMTGINDFVFEYSHSASSWGYRVNSLSLTLTFEALKLLKEIYVDSVNGDDANSGNSWYDALATIGAALSKATDGADDVIIARGSFSGQVVIDKAKVHLYGVMAGYKDQRKDVTKLQSDGSATGATILIQAYDVEIAYLFVAGNPDTGKHYPAIFVDGDNGGTRAFIHDCQILGSPVTWDSTKYASAIKIVGDRVTVKNNIIDRAETGIYVTSGVVTTYDIIIEGNEFRGCTVGIKIDSYQSAVKQHDAMIADNYFNGQGAGITATKGIEVSSGIGAFIKGNYFANYSDPIDAPSASLIENYEETAGGSKITG